MTVSDHDVAGARTLVGAGVAVGLLPLVLVIGPDLPDVATFAVGAVIVVVGAFLMLLGLRPMPTPAAFLLRSGAFVVPGTLAWAAYVAGLALLVGVFVTAGAAAGGLLAIFLVMLILVPAVDVLRDRPLIELTPAGVAVRGIVGRHEIPWAQLRRPQAPTTSLRLIRTGASRPRVGSTHSYAFVGIDSEFLLRAITYYVDHPDERATIGTAAGHDHLVAALGSAASTIH